MHRRILGKKFKWQAPGNSKIFDSDFWEKSGVNTIVRDRTIWTLLFIRENCPDTTVIKKELSKYLEKNIDEFKINKSYIIHFIKPLIFFGLVDEITVERNQKKYILTTNGRIFLEDYEKKEKEKCNYHFLMCLLMVKYPNIATNRTNTPMLYPFRIIFWLINKYNGLSSDDFKKWIPFINNKNDLERHDDEVEYSKFHTWVINSLVDIKILSRINGIYNFYNDEIKNLIMETEYISCVSLLFHNTACDYEKNKRVDFSEESKILAKKMSNFLCSINKEDRTFKIYDKNDHEQNFLHVHHVIPASMQKSFPGVDLASIDNAIALCPYCHELIHRAIPEERFKIICIMHEIKKDFLSKLKISPYELLQIYQNL
ncbi:MAG: HNH endonuclease [Mycoplasmataceae bacterium]|nr:HNH endonuclease [Mycoplasmataceae bacterium]